MMWNQKTGKNPETLHGILIQHELKNSRAIFEINHNDYRLIAEINYLKGWVFIKFIGTHAEYDKVDAESVNLFRNQKRKL